MSKFSRVYISLVKRQKGLTISHLHTHLDPLALKFMECQNLRVYISSVKRQKDLTISHLHIQLDPFALKLLIYVNKTIIPTLL